MAEPQHADTRLYLVVHQSLRLTLDRFVGAAERLDPATLAAVIPDRWALFARALHNHHEHEDSDFFPMIAAACPDEQPLIEQLEREHRELVALLDAVDAAVAALVADPNDATRRAVHDGIAAVRDTLVPHLDVEDEELLPAAATTVDPKEWDDASDRALKAIPKADLPIAAGILDEVAASFPPDRRPPPPPLPLRVMLAVSWRRRYAKFVEPLTAP
jgi:hemerythrin-like domain-containing protein